MFFKKAIIFVSFFLFTLLFAYTTQCSDTRADLVIFSYNRPLQLYALLESVSRYITGIQEIRVVYRFDNAAYAHAYEKVNRAFPQVKFTAQGKNPHTDFKFLTLQATFKSPAAYVLFAVDDIIVKDYICLTDCIAALQQTGAYGFYLRLGTNLCRDYPQGDVPLPALTQVNSDMYAWHFSQGAAYWAYPHTVDMTLYRKQDIKEALEQLSYKAPNSLEAAWACSGAPVAHKMGLCYTTSKIVNIPVNIVQTEWTTPHMNSYDANSLLRVFNKGLKIRIDDLQNIQNTSTHMNFALRFIKR